MWNCGEVEGVDVGCLYVVKFDAIYVFGIAKRVLVEFS